MTRGDFIRTLGGAAAVLPFESAVARVGGAKEPTVYDYWCTWGIQNGLVAADAQRDKSATAGDQGARGARERIDEKLIFGADGWADFFPDVRRGLYMMLDDGWDVAHGVHPSDRLDLFGSLDPAPDRFWSFGDTPVKRLAGINRALKDRGWRGAGLWVAAQNFTARKLEASAKAGIGYWKVDWGRDGARNDYRRQISETKNRIYPELIVEHMPNRSSVFNDWEPATGDGSGRLPEEPDEAIVARMSFSDVVRIYDMLGPTETATALERIRYYSRAAERGGNGTVLNVEDNPVVGAVLGHAFGLMRYPRADAAQSVTVGATGIDEVNRALAWRRFAPVFGARRDFATVTSAARLTASFVFRRGQGWAADAWGREVRQSAPAVVARGLALPEVTCSAARRPFVLASRNPNGALAVAVLPPLAQNEARTPPADVTLAAALERHVPLGVFGEPKSVTLKDGLGASRVFARDLLGGRVEEITAAVQRREGRATIPGDVLASVGMRTERESAPGVLVEVKS